MVTFALLLNLLHTEGYLTLRETIQQESCENEHLATSSSADRSA